jgi:putative DNA primase/helicase
VNELAQWINWRYEERDCKLTKVPLCPHTGKLARVDQPETWGSYEETLEASKKDGCGGVGFVFTEEDPYAGIDLDDIRDSQTGEIEESARKIIEQLNSYAELSPSGTGSMSSSRPKYHPADDAKVRSRFTTPDASSR